MDNLCLILHAKDKILLRQVQIIMENPIKIWAELAKTSLRKDEKCTKKINLA